MAGGLGNDTYYVDDVADVIVESAGEGTDTVRTALSTYALADNADNLIGTSATGQMLTGNDLANSITGTAANDIIYGEAGNDSLTGGAGDDELHGGEGNDTMKGGVGDDAMAGGLGNDNYYVDDIGDEVTENAGEGTDTVRASLATYSLGSNFENLVGTVATGQALTGNELNNSMTGGAGDDSLTGGDGNDSLNGGAGADVMSGGDGNDIYTVDDAGDDVVELADEGTDTVKTSLDSYTLGDNVEKLTGTVATGQILTGNALANTITGNAGADALYGGAGNDALNGGVGADIMAGGLDNDTYTIDDAGDQVSENADEGTDTVRTSLSEYTLGDNLENLTGIVATGQMLTGNESANVITGGGGNDTLNGAGGDDNLRGGAGNDAIYGGEGNDILNGAGGNDILMGEAGNDTIVGGTEDDRIEGGIGDDRLTGSGGNDTFVFRAGFGKDIITDFKPGALGNEVIEFHDGMFLDFNGLINAATTSGSSTIITLDASTTITLQHVALANLTQDDFLFV
jgi:serralysin